VQGAVGFVNIRLTANLLRKIPVKVSENRSRFDIIVVVSLWPRFFGPPSRLIHRVTGDSDVIIVLYLCQLIFAAIL